MSNIKELRSHIDHRAGVIERWVWDEDRGCVTVYRDRLESDAPQDLTLGKSYRCYECKDKGLAQVAFEYTKGTLLIQTTTRAVCHCSAGQPYIGKYATVKDLTGKWRFEKTLAVNTPKPSNIVPLRPIEPQPGEHPRSGGAPSRGVLEEQNLDDF